MIRRVDEEDEHEERRPLPWYQPVAVSHKERRSVPPPTGTWPLGRAGVSQSLTHSLTRSLTHSLTRSLTRSFVRPKV